MESSTDHSCCSPLEESADTLLLTDCGQSATKRPKVSIWDDENSVDEDDDRTAEQTTETLNEEAIVMSIVCTTGMVGMCYYDNESAHLYILPDIVEAPDYQLIERVLLEVEPTIILTLPKQEELKAVVRRYVELQQGRSSEVMPTTDFKYDTCVKRILSTTSFPGVEKDAGDKERLVKIHSIIPMESINMVRSLGALLKYLDRRKIGTDVQKSGAKVPILSMKRFTLSLRVFCPESHPSVYKCSTSSKEGLSMFGIANQTKSKLGAKLLRLWFLRPLCDLSTLQQRQSAIEFMCNPKHSNVVASLTECLKNIKNAPRLLHRMACSQLYVNDWHSFYKTVYNAMYICELCHSLPQDIEIFQKIASSFDDDLHKLASLIKKIIDFDESGIQNRVVVKPGIDSDLDEKKHMYNGLPDFMTKVAVSELENLHEEVKECQVIYLPQLGFLLRFSQTSWMIKEKDFQLPIEGMTFMFLSENHVHYKTKATLELDNLLGDTQSEIIDYETKIMHKLQDHILEYTDILLLIVTFTAELDCLLSLAALSMEYNYTKPELTEDNVIYIKQGRHPLHELCVSPFVPNDSCFDLKQGRMKILTGPNASGKSVYLKQVGLIVHLALIGCFVPAESAKIGLMEGIYTRLQTRESVGVGQSAFLIDMNQVSVAIQNSTSRSLILLDEFGKGTATVDGVSLLAAVLSYWLSMNTLCPNVLVSTHFHCIVQENLLPNTNLIDYLMMETLHQGTDLIFLYHLVQGVCDSSYACKIASQAGLSENIVKRGSQVSGYIQRNESIPIKTKGNPEDANKLYADIVTKYLELDLDKDSATQFLKEFVVPKTKGII